VRGQCELALRQLDRPITLLELERKDDPSGQKAVARKGVSSACQRAERPPRDPCTVAAVAGIPSPNASRNRNCVLKIARRIRAFRTGMTDRVDHRS